MTVNTEYKTISDITKWDGELLIPRRLTIETIFGCNAKCSMCVIDHPTQRKKGVMPLDKFCRAVDALTDYVDRIEMCDLFGLGEPLLDPYIFDRIRYVKEKGFRNLAISTNADLLDAEKQRDLLESGLDTLLISIDGIDKETHESIRRGVVFERVVENVLNVIRMRDEGSYMTRFVIRFIRQPSNKEQWDEYKEFWESKISPDKRDFITVYDMHSWGGQIADKDDVLVKQSRNNTIEAMPCHHPFYKMTILADGSVPLCSEDELNPIHDIGNAFETSPLEVFNSENYQRLRRQHVEKKKNEIMPCRECTILYSEACRKNNG